MSRKKNSTRRSPRTRARSPRTTSPAQNPLTWLGAGVAAWVVWGLTKPSTAGAAQSGPSSLPATVVPSPSPKPPASSPAPQLPADPHPDWGFLSQGSTGANVTTWQRALVAAQLLPASGVDGQYGPQTTAATKTLQSKAGVKVDGIVGPDTRQAARRMGFW